MGTHGATHHSSWFVASSNVRGYFNTETQHDQDGHERLRCHLTNGWRLSTQASLPRAMRVCLTSTLQGQMCSHTAGQSIRCDHPAGQVKHGDADQLNARLFQYNHDCTSFSCTSTSNVSLRLRNVYELSCHEYKSTCTSQYNCHN